MDYSSCGVGFLISLDQTRNHQLLQDGLTGLRNVEHRGGANHDSTFGDGAGIMTAIPWELLGKTSGQFAVANLFAPRDASNFRKSMALFEQTFAQFGLYFDGERDVPHLPEKISPIATSNMPRLLQVFIKRPDFCRTLASFDELLYNAKQSLRHKLLENKLDQEFFFSSLSSRTIVYKALCTSLQLEQFYPDLKNPLFLTTFVLFHRRFSTNTLPSWDKVQPFRLIAHNGEINTIEGNLTAAISREKALGLPPDQIITHVGNSDSGNLNGMVEALKYRSSIPHLNEILAIMLPPGGRTKSRYFDFWSRAMEPWDGPALITYCDGKRIGARLDRSGFRPCRWHQTQDTFYLCSEAGAFELAPEKILAQGALHAGRSVNILMLAGKIDFKNPDHSESYREASFDSRLEPVEYVNPVNEVAPDKIAARLFGHGKEDFARMLEPMIKDGKEPLGSMGDTAALAVLSDQDRSLYDFFFQNFAQVTNPPLDYIREKRVLDSKVILGRKPNIFSPKELIPPFRALMLSGPVVSLGQLEKVLGNERVKVSTIETQVEKKQLMSESVEHFKGLIEARADAAVDAIQKGATVLVISDRKANQFNPPLPALFVMRAINLRLNRLGIRLKTSLIVDSAEVRSAHDLTVLIAFGASAVCPYFLLQQARAQADSGDKEKCERKLIAALHDGVMKILAKRGISVVRSYQGSGLFSILGLGNEILSTLFPKHPCLIGGIDFSDIQRQIIKRAETSSDDVENKFLFKEHAGETLGERHSLTSGRSRKIHQILNLDYATPEALKAWENLMQEFRQVRVNLRDYLVLKRNPLDVAKVESVECILPRFGTGAMSFGSISAEAQRDLILAFREIGGRSNSGEGGENPYYYDEGISATIKQIASGRFGVTAEYLASGKEVQIKVAQGAKPGEGGQLMGPKVNADIARARHANVGVSLISPPPHHDIYSIEDLKQLIYEIKEFKPSLKVSVKLVAGDNIGAIALGVVKAGADIIHLSGGNGGTGAAGLTSMKHAGLPWELGLAEVHEHLSNAGVRSRVLLRVDGGLFTGYDLIVAAMLGADHFDFGKILLVAEGCIMARVCEKNTCPTGIATQDPKFKAKYRGKVEQVVKFLKYLANDLRKEMAELGFSSVQELIGRREFITGIDSRKKLALNWASLKPYPFHHDGNFVVTQANTLNQQLIKDFLANKNAKWKAAYVIASTDRAIPAGLNGLLGQQQVAARREKIPLANSQIELAFTGSAGQGFGVFNTTGVALKLFGEANDSVGKGMDGGSIVIVPNKVSKIDPSKSVLVGNACLYGATGGSLIVDGLVGDRFAIRNSGAKAIVRGAGFNACEYMTGGKVIILGRVLSNIGAGMTGGELFIHHEYQKNVNTDFLQVEALSTVDLLFFQSMIEELNRHSAFPLSYNPQEFIKLSPLSV